jgi:septum formation protein
MKFISLLCNLEDKRIILASQSPRRIELLRSVGLEFEIYPPRIEEKATSLYSPLEYVRHNAAEKAEWVSRQVDHDLIISADTIVTLKDKIFEKPGSHHQAESMLRELSNQTHEVITAFCLLTAEEKIVDHEVTRVTFYPISEAEIKMYLDSDEPFDKAGAYGIQGFASLYIKRIEGCYFNVVGFPLGKFYQQLKNLEI